LSVFETAAATMQLDTTGDILKMASWQHDAVGRGGRKGEKVGIDLIGLLFNSSMLIMSVSIATGSAQPTKSTQPGKDSIIKSFR